MTQTLMCVPGAKPLAAHGTVTVLSDTNATRAFLDEPLADLQRFALQQTAIHLIVPPHLGTVAQHRLEERVQFVYRGVGRQKLQRFGRVDLLVVFVEQRERGAHHGLDEFVRRAQIHLQQR